mgnify:CR=1 FL=1
MTMTIRGRRLQPVIGLEIHVQLATHSKMFCGCGTEFDAPPNSLVCPVCLAFPGALPVPNRQAVALATRLALAVGATVHPRSVFDRKSYYYPDLPKGYQITQQRHPLATGGGIEVHGRRIELERLHLEEDAGRSTHASGGASLVDLNRAGVPLVEIVSRPQLRTPEEAAAFMKEVRRIVRYLGVSDGNMEQGSLRCDANISLGDLDSDVPGARVELKNINSFRFVTQALQHEIARHAEVLAAGGVVARETRSFDPQRGVSVFMRSKEDAHDYRFFPDPDLPPLVLDAQFIEAQRAQLVELPSARSARYQQDWGLSAQDAGVLTTDRATADWFERGVASIDPTPDHGARTKALANLVIGEVTRLLKQQDRLIDSLPFGPERLVQLNDLVDSGVLSGDLALWVLGALWEADGDPAEIAVARGWRQVSDTAELDGVIAAVLSAHPAEAARYRAGQLKLRGFFVGRVMKETAGAANPRLVNERLDALLADGEPG